MLQPRQTAVFRWPQWALLAVFVCGAAAVWLYGSMTLGKRTPAGSRPLEILVSGDTSGWIVPCGCTSNQSGGLLRRGTFVRDEQSRHEVVLLDVGGAAAGASPYDRTKFEAIVAGELLMGLTAHNLGGPELALGSSYLHELAARTKAPFISANTSDNAGQPIADAFRLVSAGPRRLAIVGVVSPRYAMSDCLVSDPQTAVLATRQKLAGKFDSLIVLAYLPEDELRTLAASLPEADLVVGGPTGQTIAPLQIGPVLLASATNKGKFLVSLEPDDSHANRWRGKAIEMNAELADDEAQQRNLQHFRAVLAEKDLTAAESGQRLSGLTTAIDTAVAGSASCRDCHLAESKTWEHSAHSSAWQTLVTQGAHVDSYCQQCHTTGFGWSGGFVSRRRTPELVNVGCESCHGPGNGHTRDRATHMPLAARESCSGCHDRDNSPDFDFDKYWAAIAHGGPKE